ncbi:putative NADH-cytochrome b5 reductase 2 [Hyaloscypha bicolor E]|uniref:NADH-cytochrome b5 reductase n=1 Tax=Hyaloscypha bicolor E TaxID=1095630 RepID=A0A2J6TF15_9HELO|nr:putative NADH-cytochrome b5 reductase 2 [Hyaloscypha bicolor E]PMD61621.1 putative NADH-cytochrome b5 reductase 2 [Hyaloscypha bicolor E]
MFARQAFRAAQPLRTQTRRYATEPSSGGSNTLLYAGAAALLAGGGYYYYSQGDNAAKVKGAAKDAEAKAKDAVAAGKAKLEGISAKSAFKGGDQGFISLKLESVEDVNHNTKKLRFALPENDQVSGLVIASAILTKFKGPDMDKPAIRPYTPVSDEDEKGFLDLLVKKYPNGPMSTHLHEMQPGQSLDFKGPIPKYPWTPNKHIHVALIAGGTGITPMYQVVRTIFNNPDDKTKVTLVFANVKEEDILLKKEFDDLENTYPQRFRAFYVLDNPPKGWKGGKGFVSKELLKTVLPEPKEENIKVFVCGPPGMYKAISGVKKSPSDQGELDGSILEQLGYSKDQVYKF